MCNLFKNTLPLFLAILKLCTEAYGVNVSLHNLVLICGITDGKSEVKTMQPQCTAVAEYTNDMDRLKRVYGMKGSLPFMIIVDTVDYNNKEDHDYLDNLLNDNKCDFLALDLHKLADYDGDEGSKKFIIQFVEKLRDKIKGVEIGFLLHTDVSSLEEKIELGMINDIADFFLLQSTGYKNCKDEVYQEEMNELAPVNNIKENIQYLKDKNLDLCKLIITIELKIESRTSFSSEDMGYSYLCSHTLSLGRNYCVQYVKCLFDKARLRTEFNLTGIFIMGIEYDDVDGLCECTTASDPDPKFRGLKTIAGASQETKEPFEFYDCNKGGYPVIKEND